MNPRSPLVTIITVMVFLVVYAISHFVITLYVDMNVAMFSAINLQLQPSTQGMMMDLFSLVDIIYALPSAVIAILITWIIKSVYFRTQYSTVYPVNYDEF